MINRRLTIVIVIFTVLLIINCSLFITPCLAVVAGDDEHHKQQNQPIDNTNNNNNNNDKDKNNINKKKESSLPNVINKVNEHHQQQKQQPNKDSAPSPTTTATDTTKQQQQQQQPVNSNDNSKVNEDKHFQKQLQQQQQQQQQQKKESALPTTDTTQQSKSNLNNDESSSLSSSPSSSPSSPSSSSSSSSPSTNTNKKKQQSKFEVVIGSIVQNQHEQISQHLPIAKTGTEYRDRFINNPKYEMVPMALSNGSKYQCYVPVDQEELKNTWVPIPTADEFAQILSPLEGHCMYKPTNGWWTYELCYNKGVRQLHYEKQKLTTEYNVGVPPPHGEIKGLDASFIEKYNSYGEAFQHMSSGQRESFQPPTPRQVEAGQIPYYVEIYQDGTPCEVLVGVKRQTEVRFYCNADNQQSYIFEIQEPSTCMYYLKVYTNLMCTHPLFRPRQDASVDIECFEVLKK